MKPMHLMWTEELIIAGCRNFQKNAQKALYEKYVTTFRTICLRYTSDVEEANDLLHDCFIKIFTHFKQYSGNGSFEGWLKRIIINASINWYKANKFKNQNCKIDDLNNQFADDGENPEQETDNNDVKTIITNADFTREEILQCINQLPIGFRLVFNLYVFEDYKHKEIAKELDIDINTSKSQLSRARKLLQKKLLELYKNKVMIKS
jgi:RNA polymerase sigma factor (sigma-70 family)